MNCHRRSGGKKFRYVRRMWFTEVAHEPPRRTYWLHMNLPLYSPMAPGAALYPGYGEYALRVHSHTSPKNCDGRASPVEEAGSGCSAPLSTKLPAIGLFAADTSHSASVGSRAPAQRAYAS